MKHRNNGFNSYLKSIKTARNNIENFELNEVIKQKNRMNEQIMRTFPHFSSFKENNNTEKAPFKSPLPEFLRTISPSTRGRSRNKPLKMAQTQKPLSSISRRRVISVYSSHSKRRARVSTNFKY